jgi:heme/copper-type cytochrome/quinol oxidase subunit 2
MMILFGIPVIGWLVCIIMAFAAKNRNRRNYARAALILTLIGIAISVALYFVISWAVEAALDTIGNIEGLGDLLDIFQSLIGQ